MLVRRDLKILLNLLRICPSGLKEKDIPYVYGSRLRIKLDEIHKITRERMEIKSCKMKACNDREVSKKNLEEGQKVLLFNPQHKKDKTSLKAIKKDHIKF